MCNEQIKKKDIKKVLKLLGLNSSSIYDSENEHVFITDKSEYLDGYICATASSICNMELLGIATTQSK